MREVTILPAARGHVMDLAGRLRDADRSEIEVAGLGAHAALWHSWRGSLFARVALVDGELAAMWGLSGTMFANKARPWLLTAPAIERARMAFLRISRNEVAFMLSLCPSLFGFVDARYAGAQRLLRAVGFDLSEPFAFGPHGAPFRQYTMQRNYY